MRNNLNNDTISVLTSVPWGARITDAEDGQRKDTGVDPAMEMVANQMRGGRMTLREPLIIDSYIKNGPAIIILDRGGSGTALRMVNDDHQLVDLGIGTRSRGLTANNLVYHDAYAIGDDAACAAYGNTGNDRQIGYGGADGSAPVNKQSTGVYGHIGGGSLGAPSGARTGLARDGGPGVIRGVGPYGTAGGFGNKGQILGGCGGVDSGTGLNPPTGVGSLATWPGSGNGNPDGVEFPAAPVALGQYIQNLYIRTGGSVIGTAPPFPDTQTIVEGSADDTKLLRFEVDGFTTATTRVATWPNANGTVVYEDNTATLTNKTISGSSNTLTVLAATQLSGQVPLANGGTAANLSAPGADRILFYDQTGGGVTWLTAGSGLTITGTTMTASGGSGTGWSFQDDGNETTTWTIPWGTDTHVEATLTGDTTISFGVPAADPDRVHVYIDEDGSGPYVITWPTTAVVWITPEERPARTASDANGADHFVIDYISGVYYVRHLGFEAATVYLKQYTNIQVHRHPLAHGDFTEAVASSETINISKTLEENEMVIGTALRLLANFTGGGVTSATLDVGRSGATSRYLNGATDNIFTGAVQGSDFDDLQMDGIPGLVETFTGSGATTMTVTVTVDGSHQPADFTAGSCEVLIFTMFLNET